MQCYYDARKRWRAKGQGKGKEQFAGAAVVQPVHRYEGTDTQCSICQQEFQRAEMVTCLVCNHLYHEICWDTYQHTFDADSHECPICRRPGPAKAFFQPSGAQSPNEGRPRRRRGANSSDRPRFLPGATPPSSESSFLEVQEHVQHVYMTADATADAAAAATQGLTVEQWNEWLDSWSSMSPKEYFDQQESNSWSDVPRIHLATSRATSSNTESVHFKQASKIKIPGKKTILGDLGSNINIIGRNTTNDFVTAADTAGMTTSHVPKKNRLHVNGVGAAGGCYSNCCEVPGFNTNKGILHSQHC